MSAGLTVVILGEISLAILLCFGFMYEKQFMRFTHKVGKKIKKAIRKTMLLFRTIRSRIRSTKAYRKYEKKKEKKIRDFCCAWLAKSGLKVVSVYEVE